MNIMSMCALRDLRNTSRAPRLGEQVLRAHIHSAATPCTALLTQARNPSRLTTTFLRLAGEGIT